MNISSTEAAEDEPVLSDYQNIDSPIPVPKPEEENAPEEREVIPTPEKQEPEGQWNGMCYISFAEQYEISWCGCYEQF